MTKKLNIDILARDQTARAFRSVSTGLENVRRRVFNLRNALIGIGSIAVLRGFVNAGIEVENLGVQLNALFGSAQKGQKALEQVVRFASTTPFELRNIQQGITALATVAERAENAGISFDELLKITGNTATLLGNDFALASLQIQRSFSAGISSAELFRERGVRAMAGFEEGVRVSVDDSIKGLAQAFGTGGQFGNLTDELAKTLFGTISNLKDSFFQFQVAVSKGFFPALSKELNTLKRTIEDNQKTIEEFGKSVGENLVSGFEKAKDAVKALTPTFRVFSNIFRGIINGFLKLPPEVQNSGVILALLFGKRALAGLGAISLGANAIKNMDLALLKLSLTMAQGQFELANLLGLDTIKEEAFQSILDLRSQIQELEKQMLQVKENSPLEVEIDFFYEDHIFREAMKDTKQLEENFKFLKDAVKGFNQGLQTSMSDAIKITDDFARLGKKAFDGFADSLTDAIMTGKANFKDFARSLLADLLRIIIRQQLAVQLQRILGFSSAIAGGGTFASAIPTLFGFANGGTPPTNRPSIVGERGAEIIVPKASSTVIPNDKISNMSSRTNINFTINTVDATGVDELLTNRRSTIINVINDALNRQGKEALV